MKLLADKRWKIELNVIEYESIVRFQLEISKSSRNKSTLKTICDLHKTHHRNTLLAMVGRLFLLCFISFILFIIWPHKERITDDCIGCEWRKRIFDAKLKLFYFSSSYYFTKSKDTNQSMDFK